MNRKTLATMGLLALIVPILVIAKSPTKGTDLDPIKVGGEVYRVVLDEDRARVLEVVFAPGAEIGLHEHPDHIAYVIEGGTLEITEKGGKPSSFDLTPGQAVYLNAQQHSAKNTGKTKVRLVVFELNDPAPAQSDIQGKATDK